MALKDKGIGRRPRVINKKKKSTDKAGKGLAAPKKAGGRLKKGIAKKKNPGPSIITKKKAVKKSRVTVRGPKKSPVIPLRSQELTARLALAKLPDNPIISPNGENGWEAWQTFNPGVVFLGGRIHFLYRSIGVDGLSRLGYAASEDGFKVRERLSYPVYEHRVQAGGQLFFSASGGSWGGVEDPRITRVGGEDVLYMTYTACNGDLRVGLTSIKVNDFLSRRWYWREPTLISPPGEVHKNWVIFPEKIKGRYAILHSINPEVSVEYLDSLDFGETDFIKSVHGGKPRKDCWDKWIRGVGPVPIKTDYGWLIFYHAMDDDWGKYRVGALLTDLNEPTRVLARARAPILSPSEEYENNGFKAGVVYASGAIVKDGELLVYYGGADSYVCVAQANFEEFLDRLRKQHEPKLKSKINIKTK